MKKSKIRKNKKAFLFTLGLVLICLAILSFAKFNFEESEDEKILFQTAAITSRMNDLDDSLQRSISNTFSTYSNIQAYFDNSTLVFEESLPNSIAGLESNLNKLESFAESNETSVYLEINESVSTLPLYVFPQNITYTHNFSKRKIEIINPSLNSTALKYKTTITIEENVSCNWNYVPGDFSYELKVESIKKPGCDHDRLVDLSQNVSITITSQSESSNKITLTLSNGSLSIRMEENSIFSVDVKNEVYLKSIPEEIWLTKDIIEVEFEEFGLKRHGGAKII